MTASPLQQRRWEAGTGRDGFKKPKTISGLYVTGPQAKNDDVQFPTTKEELIHIFLNE